MKSKAPLFAAIVSIATLLALLSGCGGGGGLVGGQSTALAKVSVTWATRSRSIGAPSSALSCVVTLAGAAIAGGDFTFEFDRSANPAGYTQTYTAPARCKSGSTTATITFYAAAGGTGAVVATAHQAVTIALDGTGMDGVTLTGSVAQVVVLPGQTVAPGGTAQLNFTAEDASGNAIAVSAGSGSWALATGASFLSVTVDGIATGIASGTPTVTATVDGKTSAAAPVLVTPKAPKSYSVAAIAGFGGLSNATVYPSSINNNGDVVGYFYTKGGAAEFAFLWKGGAFTLIPPSAGNVDSVATDVNDSDLVVGESGTSPISLDRISGSLDYRLTSSVFAWQGGQFAFLEQSKSYGPSVNQSGQFVRNILNSNSYSTTVVLRTNGVDQTLPSVSQESGFNWAVAAGINAAGEVCGTSQLSQPDSQETEIWQNGVGSVVNVGYGAYAINNVGHLIVFGGNGVAHGDYLLTNGVTQLADIMGLSEVGSLNNADQLVGTEGGANFPTDYRAVIWQLGNTVDLNTLIPANSGWVLYAATHISDKGQIVGYGALNGTATAFVLTPTG